METKPLPTCNEYDPLDAHLEELEEPGTNYLQDFIVLPQKHSKCSPLNGYTSEESDYSVVTPSEEHYMSFVQTAYTGEPVGVVDDLSSSDLTTVSSQQHQQTNAGKVIKAKTSKYRGVTQTINGLLELDEMSLEEFGSALNAGDLAEVVIVRPDEEINSSSLLDEAVLKGTKRVLNARSGLSILRNPIDSYYPLVKEFQDAVSKDPPSVLPPDRGVRHEIDLVSGTKYCLTR
ncbi:reverse transcriptase [Plasmopara halstedii]|uniref:Reverse transcriptase n=1 Tax=Plasmopara halstedii TaxID=4781 RepID=A0A0P1ANH2_PLAHL|nr:reverse transcriptase [Plasmopara halstedii]CEG42970.1 reverse transcriptase [Plasmopara halstedii]|eukprot:XP_024579339.1 reverse transcriptase [Plasmopara halstedii]